MEDNGNIKVKERSNLVNAAGTLVLIAFFAIAALVLLSAGMKVYNKVVLASNNNFELRTSLSYVATKVRQSDEAGRVDIRDYDGMQVLVLSEEFDGDIYNTLIYHRNGALCELLTVEGFEPDFEFGFETMEIDSFRMEKSGSRLTFTAENASGDSDSLTIYLQSDAPLE